MPAAAKENMNKSTKRKSSDECKRTRIEKRCHLTASSTDRDYGPEAVTLNTTNQQDLQKLCKEYLESLQVTPQQAAELTSIAQNTSPNSLWQQLRRAQLTASKFGTVVKRRKNFEFLVESILYKPPPDSVAALE